jgi:hypothetical protein
MSLANSKMVLSVLPGGGFIGDVHLTTGDPKVDVNPMRVPHYQTMDPFAYDAANPEHAEKWGENWVQSKLMSGYMGQFTCFPQFGHSAAEFAASGYGQHGEAILVEWQRQPAEEHHAGELAMAAHLPLNQYAFSRKVSLLPGETVAVVTETAENLSVAERPLQWNQHVTFGPPFVEVGKMFADASIDFEGLPQGEDHRPMVGRTHKWLLAQKKHGWVAAYHADYNVLYGNIFDTADNPWLLDWQASDGVWMPSCAAEKKLALDEQVDRHRRWSHSDAPYFIPLVIIENHEWSIQGA